VVLTARGQAVDRQMALQSGADAHAAKPFNGNLLIQDVERLLAGRPANRTPLGYQIAVLRLQEGAGATTVSTNLALSLTRERGYLTVAADMVLQDGEIARQLGLPGTASRAGSPVETADDLVDQLVQHRTGLYVLPALPSQRTSSWDSNLMVEHLGQLRSWCDYVVVDTPRDLGKLASALLEASHLVLFLLTPDAATLRTARASLAAVRKMGGQTQRIWPIINLVSQAPPSLRQQVEEALGAQVVTVLPWSPEECALAMARQDPVVASYPDSPLARACQMLACHITRVAARRPKRRTTG
jgi:Flp pilus assembly CpaE family ATPase